MERILLAIFFVISGNLALAQTSLRYRVTPWSDNKKAAVTVTLDDDCDGQFTYGVPIMNARNIKGTFFIITGDGDACNGSTNWPAYVNAASYGHEVTAHTVTHPDLTTLSDSQINYEMSTSQNTIIQMVPGQRSQTFAYPYGAGGGSDPSEVRVRTIAHTYFIGARGAGVNPSGFDEYNDYTSSAFQDYYFQVESYEVSPSVDIATFKNILDAVIVDGGWFIPQYHGIQTTGYDLITSAAFTAQMDALSAKSSSLWLATFAQTLKYHKEHDSHNLAVVSENTSAWALNLTDNLPNASFDQPLTIRLKAPSWAYTSVTQGTKTLSVITDGDTLQFNAVPDGGNIIFNKGVTGPSIATNAITGGPFCAGAPVVVPFTVNGTFNSGNVFTAQLSNSSGSFTSPVNIGTLTGTASSSISANIPANTVAGSSYRIRVVSSSPAVSGTDNGTNIIINTVPVPTISSTATAFCTGGSVTLTANTGSGLSYQWIKDGTNLSGATGSTYIASVSGTYSVKETNSSGCTSTSDVLIITQNSNCVSIGTNTITGSPFCAGAPVLVSFTAGGTFNSGNVFTAQLSNSAGSFTSPVNIGSLTGIASGTISASIPANTAAGSVYRIRVVSSSPVVMGTDNGTNIIVNTVPVPTISSTTTSFCTGGSVTLTANTGSGLSYQWIKDGTNISGATGSTYAASVAGTYTVKETNSGGCSATSGGISITQISNCATITTNTVTGSPFCKGAPVQIPFTVNGTFNSGNVFTAQLSSSTGSFTNPVNIGTLSGISSGTVSANIPASSSSGTTYRIRIISSSPAVIGTDNGTNLSISSNTAPVATISTTSTTICGNSVTLSSNTARRLTHQWIRDGVNIPGATNSTYAASVPGVYTVRETNSSGCFSVSAGVTITTSANCANLSQTITFTAIPNKTYTPIPFKVIATASSGLPVSFSIVSGPATVSNDSVKITGVGTVVVRASQAGNSVYNPAPSVDRSFIVSQASQSIVFPVIPNKQLTDPPFTVNASASSGLPITFSIVSGPATISGNVITLSGVSGVVTVKASQAGNINYLAASATTSFLVGQLTQTIDFPQIPDHEALDDPFQLQATASSGLPVTFEILYGPADIEGDNYVYLWEYAGVVGVRASQAGNAQYPPVHVDQEFTVYVGSPRLGQDSILSNTAPMQQYSVYPNPAHDILRIRFDKAENIDGYTYSLQSSTGETIDGIEFITDKVLNEVEVDIRLLASGIYYLFIFDGKKTRVNKILKE